MTTTDDPEEFRERWHEHIGQLDLLKQSLDTDRWDELDEAQETLNELVEDAAEGFTDDE